MSLQSFLGGTVFGTQTGDPEVIGLHGWGRNRSDLAATLGGRRALIIDLPGFGVSPAPSHPIGARGYAELLEPLLDDVEGEVTIVGHSFGGRVGLVMAARNPDRVGGLILIGVPVLRRAGAAKSPLPYRVVRLLARWRVVSEQRLERARSKYGSADYRAAQGVMRSVLVETVNETYETEMAQVACPVELIWGSADSAVPVEIAQRSERMFSSAPSVRLTVVEGAGHDVHLSHPGIVVSVLERTL